MKAKFSETKISEKLIFYAGYRIRICIIRFEHNKSVSEQMISFIAKNTEGVPLCEICLN